MKSIWILIAICMGMVALTACGGTVTIEPPPETDRIASETAAPTRAPIAASDTPVPPPPTATSLPPTAAPTQEPTATSLPPAEMPSETPLAAQPSPVAVLQPDANSQHAVHATWPVNTSPFGLVFDGEHMWLQTVEGMKILDPETGDYVMQRGLNNPFGVCYKDASFYYLAISNTMAGQLVRLNIETVQEEVAIDYTDLGFFTILSCVGEQYWLSIGSNNIVVIEQGEGKSYRLLYDLDMDGDVTNIVEGGGYVWVAENALQKIDPATGNIVASYPYQVDWLDYGNGLLWMGLRDNGWIFTLNPQSGEVKFIFDAGEPIGPIASDERYLWLTTYSGQQNLVLLIDIQPE